MVDINKISKIKKDYENQKSEIQAISHNDVVSCHLRETKLQELETSTREELNSIKNELLDEWKEITDKMLSIASYLYVISDNDVPAISVKNEELNKLKEEETKVKNAIDEIDLFIKKHFNIDKTPEKSETESEELEDVSEELEKNSEELESSIKLEEDVLPFTAIEPDTPRKKVIAEIYNEVTQNIPSIRINDSKTRYVSSKESDQYSKITVTDNILPNAQFISESEFISALDRYLETEKDRKFTVDSKEYGIDPDKLDGYQEVLRKCVKVYIDKNHNMFMTKGDKVEYYGKVSDTISDGVYVPSTDAFYSIGKTIDNPETPEEIIEMIKKKLRKQS